MSRVTQVLATATTLLALAVPASAQFRPYRDTVGEDYHVEVSFNFWNPTPEPIVSSEALGILGTDVNLVTDLGVEKQRLKDLRVVLRPATKHKFRINYVPMNYSAETTITREFVFNGLRYRPGLPVATTAEFKAWRFGYEYDFLYRERGFLGVLIDAKVTDVNVGLNSPVDPNAFFKGLAPLPTIGGVARVYPVPNVALNAEMSYMRVPDSVSEELKGRYLDFDFSATFNAHKNFGVQAGYRSVNVNYQLKKDTGSLVFRGLYLGGSARF